MEKEVTIKSYGELFELWSTNKSFQTEYPYLPMLMSVFSYKLINYDPNSNIEIYLLSGDLDVLSDEEVKTYIYPYCDFQWIKDGQINVSNFFTNYKIEFLIRYILDKKLPVIKLSDNMFNGIIEIASSDDLIELDKYLPELNDVNHKFKFTNKNIKLKFENVTGKENYKPTAYKLLHNIQNNLFLLDSRLKTIKRRNLMWPDKNDEVYSFIRSKEGNCDVIDIVKILSYDDDKKVWISSRCTKPEYNIYFVDVCKRYNIDINTISDIGSYLIHYAAQQFNTNFGWFKKLLDYGAKMVNEDGKLLTGWNKFTIYNFNKEKDMQKFLLKYYENNLSMQQLLIEEYNKANKNAEKLYRPFITVTVVEEPTFDPEIKALIKTIQDPIIKDKAITYYCQTIIDSIQDPIMKDKLTAYYVKRLLGKN